MKQLYIPLFILLFSTPFIFSQSFSEQIITEYDLHSVFLFDSSIGWTFSRGLDEDFFIEVFHTSDGGKSWINKDTLDYLLGKSFFLNKNLGWIATQSDTILYTSDGGLNWEQQTIIGEFPRRGPFINEVYFSDSLHGLGVGDYGAIIYTNDGGSTWEYSDNNIVDDLHTVFLYDSLFGWAAGQWGLYIRTEDGGKTWEEYDLGSLDFHDVFFINSETGWLAGEGNAIYKSTDGGKNWNLQKTVWFAGTIRAVFFVDSNNGWASGMNGVLLRTIDGGENWIFQRYATFESFDYPHLYSIYFRDTLNGMIVGNKGIVLKTEDGGITFVEQKYNNIPSSYVLYQNYPNPFNPTTTIRHTIPNTAVISNPQRGERSPNTGISSFGQNDNVTLKIYDVLGKEIATLVNKTQPAGNYEVNFDASTLPSGVYYFRLKARNFQQVKKMVYLK